MASKRKLLRASDVKLRGRAAKDSKALEAEMAPHKAGYVAYYKARAAGDKATQEANRPAYTQFKRAYSKLLALRHAAYDRQQGGGA